MMTSILPPLGMEAMLAAAKLSTEDHLAERTRWQQKIERAGYEVQLARRQYDAVDPDNRLFSYGETTWSAD